MRFQRTRDSGAQHQKWSKCKNISMIDDMFPHIGTLLDVSEHIVAHVLCKIGIMKIRNNSIVTTLPPTWDDFMRSIFFASNKIEVTKVKMMMIKCALMNIGIIGDAPNNLHEACAEKMK